MIDPLVTKPTVLVQTWALLAAALVLFWAAGCANETFAEGSSPVPGGESVSSGGADSGSPSESAVVRIETENCAGTAVGRASGALLESGLVATVAHALDIRAVVRIRDSTGATTPAKIKYLDTERDLALLEPEVPLQAPDVWLALADPTIGPVQLMTYADKDLGPVVKTGSIARLATVTLDGVGQRAAMRLEATIEPGDSGGPVLQNGLMVGMVFASTRNVNRGWAIAAEEIDAALIEAPQQRSDVEELIC